MMRKKGDDDVIAALDRAEEFARGGKGDWNKDLNNPQPNKTYTLDNGDVYLTDDIGRIRTVKSELRHDPNDRNKYR
jgi:filamentous hemagglutinin